MKKRFNSNSRFFYIPSSDLALGWQTDIESIDAHIIERGLTFLNDLAIIYFFSSPLEDEFFDKVAWIGREIVGITDSSQRFKVEDLDACECFVKKINLDGISELNFEIILEQVEEIYESTPQLASTWRLEMNYPFNERIVVNAVFFYQA